MNVGLAAAGIEAHFEGRVGGFSLAVGFSAPGRGVTALFGPSGCGKTTVLRCMAGLNRLTGRLQVGDEVWQDQRRFVPTHRRAIGYVFQEASLFPHLSVQDNLNYGRRRARPSRAAAVIDFDETVALLGLEPLLNRAPTHLSGGERQRVAMGRALLSQPRLLLMDEPLAALDRFSKEEILPYLERLHERLAIPMLYVSHDIAEVERLADHLVLLKGGRVTAAGALAALLADPTLPLARAPAAVTVLEGHIAAVEAQYHLLHVKLRSGELLVPGDGRVGERRRLRISANDVSLSRHPPEQTSMLNALPCRILACEAAPPFQVTAILAIGQHGEGEQLLARISQKSWDTLNLQVGEPIYACLKAVSLIA